MHIKARSRHDGLKVCPTNLCIVALYICISLRNYLYSCIICMVALFISAYGCMMYTGLSLPLSASVSLFSYLVFCVYLCMWLYKYQQVSQYSIHKYVYLGFSPCNHVYLCKYLYKYVQFSQRKNYWFEPFLPYMSQIIQ